MQVSDLQENALRLADSIKGMEDYERIIEEFLMCTSGSYVAIQIMALFFCGRIMEEHKTWRGELIICPLRWQVLPHRKCLPAG